MMSCCLIPFPLQMPAESCGGVKSLNNIQTGRIWGLRWLIKKFLFYRRISVCSVFKSMTEALHISHLRIQQSLPGGMKKLITHSFASLLTGESKQTNKQTKNPPEHMKCQSKLKHIKARQVMLFSKIRDQLISH